jgi:hypothetical protein
MKSTAILLLFAATVFIGCGGEEFTSSAPLAQEDAGKPDQKVDSADAQIENDARTDAQVEADAATSDTNQPETGSDTNTPDVEQDATPDTDTQDTATDNALQDTGPDAEPEASTPEAGPESGPPDAQPEASPEASTPEAGPETGPPDAQPEGGNPDAGCLEGSLRCVEAPEYEFKHDVQQPLKCTGGKWVKNGGRCNFGCNNGLCNCNYVAGVGDTVLTQPAPGMVGQPDTVALWSTIFFPHYMRNGTVNVSTEYIGPYKENPYPTYMHPIPTRVKGLNVMEFILVQRLPMTMTQCSDGSEFYPFEKTYFMRDVSTVKCFWLSDPYYTWQQTIEVGKELTQPHYGNDNCHAIVVKD